MKTKLSTLSGAVLCLLAAVLGTAQTAPGAPPASTGGGTIYYTGPWPGATYGTSVMTAMNSDGSGKTALGVGMFGSSGRVLYNSHRWFIYTYVFPDQYYPDGMTRRSEVFALRGDFDITLNNNADTVVQLTNDITLQPKVGSTDWVPGGTKISFMGRRWSSAEPGATAGLTAQPATPVIPFPLVETTPGDLWPALANYFCWSPTGNRVVYANTARLELWVADLPNLHTRIFTGPGSADQPQWSPDGSTIVFRGGSGISTIKSDGTSYKVIIPNTSAWVYSGPYYSPTGSHIVYNGCHQGPGSNFDIFRATVKGASQVNLTNTPAPFNESTNPGSGAGWR